MTPADLLEGLVRCHRAAFPNGDWRGANEAIGRVRRAMDWDVRRAGLWPKDRLGVGNEELAKLHRKAWS
jgi:hypothetical protein